MRATKQILETYPNATCPWCDKEYEYIVVSLHNQDFLFDIKRNSYLYEDDFDDEECKPSSPKSYYPWNPYLDIYKNTEYCDILSFQYHHNCREDLFPLCMRTELGNYHHISKLEITSFTINIEIEDGEYVKYPYTSTNLFHLTISNELASKYSFNNEHFTDIELNHTSSIMDNIYNIAKQFKEMDVINKAELLRELG
jgi:hypothetical protein